MFSSNTSQVSSGGYEIQRSLRFNSADTTNVQRTFSTTGTSQTTSTLSMWFKRGDINRNQRIFDCYDGSSGSTTGVFLDNDVLTLEYGRGTGAKLITSAVYRDPSAWYHLVAALDSTNATSSNRMRLWINGVQVTAFSTAIYPSQNALNNWMSANSNNRIGSSWDGSANFSGYITEINFIDGQALTPSSFGAFDAQTGVWGPTPYGGSYGTNGFYLNFSDNSNTTAATLGRDYSGNSNNWTPNNFSVSAGVNNDSLVDVPTNWGTDTGVGGSVRGNYCTFNPLVARWDVNTGALSNGNLEAFDTVGDANNPYFFGTLSVSSGKFYWEITVTAIGTSAAGFFIGVDSGKSQSVNLVDWVAYASDGQKYVGGPASSYGATYTTGDVIGVALDKDANTVTFYKNNASQGAISLPTNVPMVAWLSPGSNSGYATANFGQRPFAYTAPSGFRALNTQNLPTPTIGATTATQAGKFFNTVLFQKSSFPATIDGVGFQPDWTWWKERSRAQSNFLMDTLRGPSSFLISNSTAAADTQTNLWVTNSDGWTSSSGALALDQPYVAWNWRANGAGVTNTAGSITSTVSANTTSGFSVVTYTGTGANATVGHGLGAAPRFIIIKSRSGTTGWPVYSESAGNTRFGYLNTSDLFDVNSTAWNNTSPTSSVFTIGTGGLMNTSAATYVAYCFAQVPGFSSFGGYTGNATTDGPFIFCGFRPAWVLVKRQNGADDWHLFDNRRDGFNALNDPLYPNGTFVEGSGFTYMDLVSNGFKCRNNSFINVSGVPYIYAAFAEAPQKFALAR